MSDSSRIVASELRKSVQVLRDKRAEWAAEDHRESGVCYCPQPLPSRQYMGQESCRLCDGLIGHRPQAPPLRSPYALR